MRRLFVLFSLSALLMLPATSSYAQNKSKTPVAKKTQTTSKATNKSTQKKPTQKTNSTQTHTYSNKSIRGLEGQRAAIQKKIREQEAKLKKNEADVRQRLQNLMSINSEIDHSQKKIDDIQKDIHHIDGNIGLLQSQLKNLEAQLQERKMKYIKSMRYMARHRTVQDRLMFVFSAKSFTQMYRRLNFVRQYAAYQKAQGETVKAKQMQVQGKHKELQHVKGTKNNLLSKGEQEKASLQSKQEEQQSMVNDLQKQQKTIQKILDQQRQKDAALNAQIDREVALEVERTRKRAAAEAARKSAAELAAKKRAAEEAQKRAAAEAKANAERIAAAKKHEEELKAAAESARKAAEEAKRAQAAAAEAKKAEEAAAAAREAKAAAERKAKAEQAAREAEAARKAAERKAKAEEARNKREIAAAKEEAKEAETLSNVDRKLSDNFESNKGRLPMPITGSYNVVSHFGQYNVEGLNGVTLDNKGINILGKPGCRARALFDGEVSAVFGFGGSMVVMVRHGAYISVYCNLASVMVKKGERVATRQAIGVVGPNNILQFQLRKETAKLNPEAWIGR